MPLDFPSSPTPGQVYLNWTWNGTAWIVAPGPPLASLAQSSQNAGRNYLDNALFNVQQRGQGVFSANGYTADRWTFTLNLDTSSVSLGAATDAARAEVGDESFTHFLNCQFTGNAGAAAYTFIQQPIEGVQRLSGKTVTISFWAGASVAGLRLGIGLGQNFGSGGSPSPNVNLPGQSVTLTTAYARYSVTFTLPSTAGKTLGTSGNDITFLQFWFSSGTTQGPSSGNIGVQAGSVSLWGMQLEVGSQATPLEKLVPEVDLARCQRFFVSLLNMQIAGANLVASTQNITLSSLIYPVTMRAAPTVLGNGPSYTNCTGINFGANSVLSTLYGISCTASANFFASYSSIYLSADL